MLLTCKDCNNQFEAKRKDTQRCPTCKKKERSKQVMLSRQKRNPNIELGVGSGRAKNNQAGPTNQSWKTGITGYRKLVVKKECAYCNSTKNLLIHHLDENRHNNELSNLVVLCKSCHQKHHCQRSPITGQYLAK